MHSKEQSRSRLSDGTKQGALRVAFAVGVLALLAVMLLILSVFQARRPVSSLKQNGFLPGSGKATVYAAAGNGLAAAKTDAAELYSPAGKAVAVHQVGFAVPMCAGGASVSVFYDDGRAGLHALYPDGAHRFTDTEGGVIFAEVNETGLVTVILDVSDTPGTVMVFDTDLKPLFRWDAGSGYPISARISADDVLCVNCASPRGGELHFFRIDREAEQGFCLLENELVVDVGFMSDGTLAAVTEEDLWFISDRGERTARYSFEGGHLDAWCLRGGFAAVATVSGNGGGQSRLTTLDASGQVMAGIDAAGHAESVAAAGDMLLVLFTGQESTLYEADLTEIVSYQPEEGVNRIFLTRGGMAYFAGPEGVTQIDFGRN